MLDTEIILKKMTLEEKASLCSGLDFWRTKPVERLGVPSLLMADGPHGLRKQISAGDHLGINESIKTVCFPTASALASTFDTALIAELGNALADICRREDVDILLGPGVNIKRSPLCGRNFEYYSEDPYLAGEIAAAFIAALESGGVSATVKHFACNNQETARMFISSDIDERTLFEIYFPAFEAAVAKGGASLVMTSYNKLNGVNTSENDWLLGGVLRGRWGFDGVTVTDWGAISDRVKALYAGQDIEMPYSGGETDKRIVDAVKNNVLPEEVLDDAVRRILALIEKAEKAKQRPKPPRKDYHELARKIASESAVLLKNDGVLPLLSGGQYVCIGDFALTPRIQGSGSSRINADRIDIPLDELRKYAKFDYKQGFPCDSSDYKDLLSEAVEAARMADGAVIFAGLPCDSEGTDRKDISLPPDQNKLIEEVCKAQPKTAVVLMTGSAVSMPWQCLPSAIINFHLGGQAVGSAVADILFGKANPCGKLSETYPVRIEDTPCYLDFPGNRKTARYREGVFVGYRYYDCKKIEPLYPFGHGLSYTSFEYGPLEPDKKSMKENGVLKLSLKIKNTGAHYGKEVVQVYVRELLPKVVRPEKELKSFTKIALLPNEQKTVEIILDRKAFAYYDEEVHDWVVGDGAFEILAGSSSRDIRQRAEIRIENTYTRQTAIDASMPISEILAYENARGTDITLNFLRGLKGGLAPAASKGSDEFSFEKLLDEMPLRALVPVTQGKISFAQIEQTVRLINSYNPVLAQSINFNDPVLEEQCLKKN